MEEWGKKEEEEQEEVWGNGGGMRGTGSEVKGYKEQVGNEGMVRVGRCHGEKTRGMRKETFEE